MLALGFARTRVFEDTDRTFLLAVGPVCAQALERVRLHGAERGARAQAEMLAAERASILDQLAEGVLIADNRGEIHAANAAARQLFGWSADDSAATFHLLNAAGEPFPFEEHPLVRAAMRGEFVVGTDMRIVRADGQHVLTRGSAVPLLAPDGTRRGAAVTLHDVTAQRELDRLREEFFANASHDLRTPVATIKSAVEVLLAHEPPGISPQLHRMLVIIDTEAKRMTTLANDLLELARLNAAHAELHLDVHDARRVAERAARAIDPLVQQRGQRLMLDLPVEPVMLNLDADRLERALVNLLVNAHKYGRSSGTIRFAVAVLDSEVRFTICDDGPGIAAIDQTRVFSRFYRGRTAATRRVQGSGLGLPIARAIAELHHGRLGLESSSASGTTFVLSLPASSSVKDTQ